MEWGLDDFVLALMKCVTVSLLISSLLPLQISLPQKKFDVLFLDRLYLREADYLFYYTFIFEEPFVVSCFISFSHTNNNFQRTS